MAFASEKEQRLALEKLREWGQWAELEPTNPKLRFIVVESDPNYHTFSLYDRLIEASSLYIRSEPAEAVDILRLAILVAEHLNVEEVGAERLADLRGARLGDAWRSTRKRRTATSRDAFSSRWVKRSDT